MSVFGGQRKGEKGVVDRNRGGKVSRLNRKVASGLDGGEEEAGGLENGSKPDGAEQEGVEAHASFKAAVIFLEGVLIQMIRGSISKISSADRLDAVNILMTLENKVLPRSEHTGPGTKGAAVWLDMEAGIEEGEEEGSGRLIGLGGVEVEGVVLQLIQGVLRSGYWVLKAKSGSVTCLVCKRCSLSISDALLPWLTQEHTESLLCP
ncbi:uncharacterized protein PAC_04548 [Phialocephala subalpina]|uniref:Uncharacterized protein n=1 Tax=Phialocephala subalpina TaxID=576137 RepID=A0A1L7WPG3_9HELO|nr:uncharacterized protein PAC_04548 [Phialocephala subalpina]